MEKITKHQIKKLLSKFSAMYKLQQTMSKCINHKKTFALAGRMVGDIGECLADYLFNINVWEKQRTGCDGETKRKNIPVEIKVRTISEENETPKHIHISDSTFNAKKIGSTEFYLIFFTFDIKHRKIIVKTNTLVSGKPRINVKNGRSKDKGFVTFNQLQDSLKDGLYNKPLRYTKGIKPDKNNIVKIGCWKVQTKETPTRKLPDKH